MKKQPYKISFPTLFGEFCEYQNDESETNTFHVISREFDEPVKIGGKVYNRLMGNIIFQADRHGWKVTKQLEMGDFVAVEVEKIKELV